MTFTTTIPVLCILIGLLVYGLAPNHRQLGLVTFGCGLLVALLQVASKTFHF